MAPAPATSYPQLVLPLYWFTQRHLSEQAAVVAFKSPARDDCGSLRQAILRI